MLKYYINNLVFLLSLGILKSRIESKNTKSEFSLKKTRGSEIWSCVKQNFPKG